MTDWIVKGVGDVKKKMAIFLAVILFLDVVALIALWIAPDNGNSLGIEADAPEYEADSASTTTAEQVFSRVSFVAVGDNLIHDTIYEQAAARTSGDGYDFSYNYENVKNYISEPDVAILNQETIISTEHNVSSYPTFNSPAELGQKMLEIGFDVFNIATNHSLDKGEAGLISTINYWKEKNAITTGAYLNRADMEPIRTNTVNGVTVAYLGFTELTNGLSLPEDSEVVLVRARDEEVLKARIEKAKTMADFVIVNAHWGVEYTHEPNEEQKQLAQKLAAWGADVIIGTHPHVIQPLEFIDNEDGRRTLVAYSLGNFISAQNRGPRMLGGMLNFELVKNNVTGKTSIENVDFSGVVTHYGQGYSNIRVYALDDYTEELANAHGVISKTSSFSKEYLENILTDVIDEQFLR